MKSLIIVQPYNNKKQNEANPTTVQAERLKKYCTSKGFEIVKEFCLDRQKYKKQQSKINEIINTIAEQQESVAVCFDRENHLPFRILHEQALQLFDKASRGEIELHFISSNLQEFNNGRPFDFSLIIPLDKYYADEGSSDESDDAIENSPYETLESIQDTIELNTHIETIINDNSELE